MKHPHIKTNSNKTNTTMKTLHLIMLALLGAMISWKHGSPVYLAANEAGTEGSHTGPVTFTAGTAMVRNRLFQFANPADPHDRTIEYADGTGTVIGVTVGNSDAGQPIAGHVFGATPGTAVIETTGAIARLDKISPAADGKGIVAGDGAALSADVVAAALEGNDLNDEVECVCNAGTLFD